MIQVLVMVAEEAKKNTGNIGDRTVAPAKKIGSFSLIERVILVQGPC